MRSNSLLLALTKVYLTYEQKLDHVAKCPDKCQMSRKMSGQITRWAKKIQREEQLAKITRPKDSSAQAEKEYSGHFVKYTSR